MRLCEKGKRIALRVHDIVVYKDGEPSLLYYHILDCDDCEAARESEININIRNKKDSLCPRDF